jgi:hypothetical protein
VTLIAVKVLLAPSFVVGTSMAARRFGARTGGLIAGLPVVAGPILLAYALANGRGFAANAAAGTLLGLVSLIAFVVVYARLAQRLSWATSMVIGWLVFVAFTAAFSGLHIPAAGALPLALAALMTGLLVLPRQRPLAHVPPPPPSWDLPLRAACAMTLVLSLTAIAGWLGPQLSGLLAPFPIIATVLAVFTHAQRGTGELVRLLRGMVSGFAAFALFFFTLAVTLRHMPTAAAFALATGLAVGVQGLALLLLGRRSAEPLPQLAGERAA